VKSESYARLVTDLVVRNPRAWRLVRGRLRDRFDTLAATWETRIGPHHLWALDLALADVAPPRRALDLGTGTGVVAKALAERFPAAEVVGLDISPAMIDVARGALPPELADRVRFGLADAAALPCDDGEFQLVALSNMIPFFAELARVTGPGGTVVISFSRGAQTPIYVPPRRLRRELGRRGFVEFAEFSAPPATALRATRG
jgi:ubiquinone/menaquinone biosynthesis C-methylase UbiE